MISIAMIKRALWGLAGVLLCALTAQANLFVVAGGGKSYKNVVVVAQSGGHYTTVQDALDSISGADQNNRYLIFVGPGTYTGRFTMEPYVDIAGSGPNVTILQAGGGATLTSDAATCTGADNATLRDLTVKNTGGALLAIAVLNNGVSTTLWRVHMHAEGATGNTHGLVNAGGSPIIKECTITAEQSGANANFGVMNSVSSPTFQNCDIGAFQGAAAYAVYNSGGFATFQDCRMGAGNGTLTNRGMQNTGIGCEVQLYHSQVSAEGSGSANQTGIFNTDGAHVRMFSCRVESLGGNSTIGVANLCPSTDAQIDAMFAHRCTIRAKDGASSNMGVSSDGKSNSPRVEVYLNHCDIEATTNTVYNATNVDTYLGACLLNGGPTYAGTTDATMTCAGCYDENYAFSASTCP